MGSQFGERVGHGAWLIGPKLFRPKAYPTSVSSKLCEFILFVVLFDTFIGGQRCTSGRSWSDEAKAVGGEIAEVRSTDKKSQVGR